MSKSSSIVPTHIAIICDGNRRWARSHALEVLQGHEAAVNKIFEPLIDRAAERGIKFLTFWIFSTENWDREAREVEGLMNLFRSFFDRQIEELHKKGVRVNMIGDLTGFAPDIQAKIRSGMEQTRNNTRIIVTLAMNYGGRDEIVRAVNEIVKDVRAGKIDVEHSAPLTGEDRESRLHTTIARPITERMLSGYLDTGGNSDGGHTGKTHGDFERAVLPDPDFIIRTSGEQRLSGFMMWQSEYAEFWFPPFHFPEFTPEKLNEAIEEFGKRQRRFGR